VVTSPASFRELPGEGGLVEVDPEAGGPFRGRQERVGGVMGCKFGGLAPVGVVDAEVRKDEARLRLREPEADEVGRDVGSEALATFSRT
jgi:hypothetical protein